MKFSSIIKTTYFAAIVVVSIMLFLNGCIKGGGEITVTLEITPESIDDIPWEGGKYTLDLKSNSSWEVTMVPQWCSVYPSSGKGNMELTVSVDENETTDFRNSTIAVLAGAEPVEVTLLQEGKPEEPTDIYELIIKYNNGDTSFADALKAITPPLDIDEDGALSAAEAEAVEKLDISGEEIISVVGIKLFTKLREFTCTETSIKSLDVSGMALLEKLDARHNQSMKSISVGGCTAMRELNFSDSAVSASSGLRQLVNVEAIGCYATRLESLDLGGLTKLKRLYCQDNINLTSIDVSGCAALEDLVCSGTTLYDIDVSGLASLVTLDCSDCNELASLTLGGNTALVNIYCNGGSLISLDASGLPALQQVLCADNPGMETLNVRGSGELEYLACNNTALGTLDISTNKKLGGVDCRGCPYLETIVVWWDPAGAIPIDVFYYDPDVTELVRE